MPPHIFKTLYQHSSPLWCTLQHIKNLGDHFFLARYGPIWLLKWSKMKNSNFSCKSKTNLFIKKKWYLIYKKSQNSSFLTMSKVKLDHILPKQKMITQFFICCKVHDKVLEYWYKVSKCWWQLYLFLPWTQVRNWLLRPSFHIQVQNSCFW